MEREGKKLIVRIEGANLSMFSAKFNRTGGSELVTL